MRRCTYSVMIFLLTLPLWAKAHDLQATARYIGNAGVLVASGDSKVIFDAFYAVSYGQYVLVSDQTRTALMTGQPPYDGIDALVVSHIHGDHFTAKPTLTYLRAQPQVHVVAPSQVIEKLQAIMGKRDQALLDRLHGFELQPGQPFQRLLLDNLRFGVVAIPHSGGARLMDIENLAFRVTLGESVTVLHLGDATTDDSEFARQQTFWDARPIDTAFPPYWFLVDDSGRTILETRIKARQVIGVHVPAEASGHGEQWRQRLHGDLFTDPGEVREFDHPDH